VPEPSAFDVEMTTEKKNQLLIKFHKKLLKQEV
jgi:hypothetical protein